MSERQRDAERNARIEKAAAEAQVQNEEQANEKAAMLRVGWIDVTAMFKRMSDGGAVTHVAGPHGIMKVGGCTVRYTLSSVGDAVYSPVVEIREATAKMEAAAAVTQQ